MNLKQLISVPRILGIVLIILAVLVYQTQGFLRTALLAIVGLVLMLTPTHRATAHWWAFLNSWRLKKEFVFMMLFDILFWVVLAILTLIMANVLQSPTEQLKTINTASFNIGAITSYNAIIESFFITAIITFVVFWLLTVIAYSFSRGLIWLTLLEKPMHTPFFIRFSLLNLIWCTIWTFLIILFMITMVPPISAVMFVLMMLLYAHLTTILHYSYTKTRAFGKAVKDAFGIGLGMLARFVHPYCYLFIVYVILSQFTRFVQGNTLLVVTFIVFLVFMAWYRTYLRNILRHIA